MKHPQIEITVAQTQSPLPSLISMNFWVPGSAAPGVDREYEEEGIYMVNNTQTRLSLDQQVRSFSPVITFQRHDLPIYKYRREIL